MSDYSRIRIRKHNNRGNRQGCEKFSRLSPRIERFAIASAISVLNSDRDPENSADQKKPRNESEIDRGMNGRFP